jgi:hypothetical protein
MYSFASPALSSQPPAVPCATLSWGERQLMAASSDSPSSSGSQYREKREVPRYSFIATVVIVEPATDMRINGRVSEISRKGCYVDVLNTLPVGTPIQLAISRDQGSFTTPAKIIYVQEGIGMGVAFVGVNEPQLKILDAWLAEISS